VTPKQDIPPGERLTPFEVHHAWWGLILAAIGFIVFMALDGIASSITGGSMVVIGLALTVEDCATHLYQKHVNPEFVGYVHRWYVWIVRKVKGWL